MAEPPAKKDMEDILRHMTELMRADPTFQAAEAGAKDGLVVFSPAEADAKGPSLLEVDLLADAEAITVTALTRNADPATVHVTLTDNRLSIGLGEGEDALRKEVLLPGAVDEERAVATLRNGILDIVLPRRTLKAQER